MTNLLWVALMFCGGAAIAVQPSINARLAQKVGVIESACISFAVGTLVLFLVLAVQGKVSVKGMGDTVWWEWTGGALGAFFVSMALFLVPRIGTTAAMAVTIAAQLTAGIILDHYGAFGLRHIPLDGKRVIGSLLLFAGAALIARR
ncbi:DMT family transporter [Geomonas sp. Red32]|uniref:DMT family transporter n=1 Tax=Geomonas sp. Red32 TaxID=2912856 RepID=UPI00202CCE72|nr:DMT family transporter [Geomonas sp. Red32]